LRPKALMQRAERAVASARLLLDAGDVDWACSRAYYAMFDAARGALIVAGVPSDQASGTHSGLIAAFGLHLVKTGRLSTDLGRALNRAAEIRLVADYTGEEIPVEQARLVVDQAAQFVETVSREIVKP
jgi:uncharacterized protein (UPF0332 family)